MFRICLDRIHFLICFKAGLSEFLFLSLCVSLSCAIELTHFDKFITCVLAHLLILRTALGTEGS